MADGVPKGTVKPLASLISVEEAQKAAKRVHEAIAEREKEASYIERFITENNNLFKLVHTLPDQLSHHIMVPFGKAAFFPGRLIHTNEFLVLLGDGYYADQTSRQTAEILHRRGKVLESKLESLKAMMLDLQAEASFFDSTASEAADGLVEIREDYIEEQPTERKSESGLSEPNIIHDDEEGARAMARMDELEKLEEEACSDDEDSDFECSSMFSGLKLNDPVRKFMDENRFSGASLGPSSGNFTQTSPSEKSTGTNPDLYKFDGTKAHLVAEGGKDMSASVMGKSNVTEKPLFLSTSKEGCADSGSKIEKVPTVHHSKKEKDFGDNVGDRPAVNRAEHQKAQFFLFLLILVLSFIHFSRTKVPC
ncbi:hypothetical protein AAC387_Pa02g1282 [Persea americana]